MEEEEERLRPFAWGPTREERYNSGGAGWRSWPPQSRYATHDECTAYAGHDRPGLGFEEIIERNGPLPATSRFFEPRRWTDDYDYDDDYRPEREAATIYPHNEARVHDEAWNSSSTSAQQPQEQEQASTHDVEDETAAESPVCRVCRCESTPEQPLFYPCLCKGSIRYIHQDCLIEWLKHSNKTSCELCKLPFRFQPVYAENAPLVLASHELLFGIIKKAARSCKHVLGIITVCLAWFLVVPLCTSWIWRLYFSSEFKPSITHNDVIWGSFLSVAIFILFLGLSWLLEYMQTLPGGLIGWHNNQAVAHHNEVEQPRAEAIEMNNQEDQADNADAAEVDEELELVDEDIDEELEFEELVGLRGSWRNLIGKVSTVLAFNAAVLAALALLPYWIGHFALQARELVVRTDVLQAPVGGEQLAEVAADAEFFSDLKAVAVGYLVLAFSALAWMASIVLTDANLSRAQPVTKWITSMLHFIFIFIKVAGLLFIELGVFPEMCGWLFDICSLPLFEVSLASRLAFFRQHPYISTLVHWGIGMLFMYSISCTLQWLRSVLRPGVLWFFRTPEDPDFDVIQEMIQVSLLRQVRRMLLTVVFFSSVIGLFFGAPIAAAKWLPAMLPLNMLSEGTIYNTSTDIVLFHIIVPMVLKYARPVSTLKAICLWWMTTIGSRLQLDSYLFERNQQQIHLPSLFPVRILALLLSTWGLFFGINLVMITFPLTIGRFVFATIGLPELSDFYAYIVGSIVTWLLYRGAQQVLDQLAQHSTEEIFNKSKDCIRVATRSSFVGFFILFAIPLMIGTLFDVTLCIPIRVPWLDQCPVPTPLFQNWTLGLFFLKIWHKMVLMLRPDSEWKQRVLRITQDGYANINILRTWNEVLWPISMTLAAALFVPYFIGVRVIPLLSESIVLHDFSERYCYLVAALMLVGWRTLEMLRDAIVKLHDSIRDEKYLVGRHLQNYEEVQQQQ